MLGKGDAGTVENSSVKSIAAFDIAAKDIADTPARPSDTRSQRQNRRTHGLPTSAEECFFGATSATAQAATFVDNHPSPTDAFENATLHFILTRPSEYLG